MSAATHQQSNGSLSHKDGSRGITDLGLRNRRLATFLGVVVILLMLLSMAYIHFFGGVNKGPMKPLGNAIISVFSV